MALNENVFKPVQIGFIGAGRLGRALAWALEAKGFFIHAAASLLDDEARALSEKTRSCAVVTAQEVADNCDLVFITTPDSVIKSTADGIRWRAGSAVVHCSGATELDALAKANSDGALVGGFHPMQTFGDPEVAARTLAGCVITIEATGELNAFLNFLVDSLGCTPNQLPAGERGRYHAAAGYASQYVNVLLAEAVKIWSSWGASEDVALRALLPVVRGTVSSIESVGLAKGMPGPVSRGDSTTVVKHLESLKSIDPVAAELYRELCLRSVALAEAAGGIDNAVAQKMRMILRPATAMVPSVSFSGIHY